MKYSYRHDRHTGMLQILRDGMPYGRLPYRFKFEVNRKIRELEKVDQTLKTESHGTN